MDKLPALYPLGDLIYYFVKLGTIGFGGPVASVSYMHRDLVEKRKWISEQDYKEGLALAQLAPGPLAAQLAIYTRRSFRIIVRQMNHYLPIVKYPL